MFRCLKITVLSMAWCSPALAQEVPPTEELRLNVSELVSLISDGYAESNPEGYSIHIGQILDGAEEDAIVLFVVEGLWGGNNYAQYLALFAGIDNDEYGVTRRKRFRLLGLSLVGDRGWRFFDPNSTRLEPGSVTLSGDAYSASDAMCCPSQPITKTFRVTNGQILER